MPGKTIYNLQIIAEDKTSNNTSYFSLTQNPKKKPMLGGWRDGSVKSTNCSSMGPGINSQHPHSRSIILVPGDSTHSQRHTCRQKTNAHKNKNK